MMTTPKTEECVVDEKLRAHPVAKSFLLEEEFAMARFQLLEAIEKHKPYKLASCRKGSTFLWEKVEKVMYDPSHGQFCGMKPYSSRRNFRNFVTKVFTQAKNACREDNATISKTTQGLNAVAIKYDEVCKVAKDEIQDKKEEEQAKKERLGGIERNMLNLHNAPPSFTPTVPSPLEDTAGLQMLSALSESVANDSVVDNHDCHPTSC